MAFLISLKQYVSQVQARLTVTKKSRVTVTVTLPLDVVIGILVGLPVKSLLRFRCVCKAWNDLLVSPYFIDLYRGHPHGLSNAFSNLLMVEGSHLQYWDLDSLCPISSVQNYPEVPGLEDAFNSSNAQFVGLCSGMLCYHHSASQVFLLYNRVLGTVKQVPFSVANDSDGSQNLRLLKGFGYDQEAKDWKIVSMIDTDFDSTGSLFSTPVYVYSLKSDSWMTTCDLSPGAHVVGSSVAKYVNNALHWLIRDYTYNNQLVIHSYDLHKERFNMILPPPIERPCFSVLGLDGCLSVLCNSGRCFEAWMVTTKHGAKRTIWTRLFCIEDFQILAYSSSKQRVLIRKRDRENLGMYILEWYDTKSKKTAIKSRSFHGGVAAFVVEALYPLV